ncbi:MAG: hypothetical protein ACK58T_00525, partial [Phycisphaerae bacterium]
VAQRERGRATCTTSGPPAANRPRLPIDSIAAFCDTRPVGVSASEVPHARERQPLNTPRLVPLVGVVAAMSASAVSASAALTQWMSHTFELSIQPSASSGLAPQPNVVRFYGMSLVSLSEIPDAAGVMNNPLYEDKGLKGDNQLFEG